jgi:hypothetical protein
MSEPGPEFGGTYFVEQERRQAEAQRVGEFLKNAQETWPHAQIHRSGADGTIRVLHEGEELASTTFNPALLREPRT